MHDDNVAPGSPERGTVPPGFNHVPGCAGLALIFAWTLLSASLVLAVQLAEASAGAPVTLPFLLANVFLVTAATWPLHYWGMNCLERGWFDPACHRVRARIARHAGR